MSTVITGLQPARGYIGMIRYVSDRKFRNLEIIDFGHGTFSSAVDGTTRAREMLRRRKSQIRALTQTGDGVDGLSYLSCDTSDGGEGSKAEIRSGSLCTSQCIIVLYENRTSFNPFSQQNSVAQLRRRIWKSGPSGRLCSRCSVGATDGSAR